MLCVPYGQSEKGMRYFMKVKDFMCDEVCFVKPDAKVVDVAKIMKDNHIGCVPVCDDENSLCGILTDRDILLRTVACNKDVNTTPVSEIMTTNVCSCKKEEEMPDAQEKMSSHQIRRLPVCDENNKVVGILTLGNLAENDSELGKEKVCSTLNNICDCETHKNNQ